LIVGYDDRTNNKGFRFEVKLKQQTSATWSPNEIVKKFKLAKNHAENLTVIGPAGELREYNDARDLVRDFVDFRLTMLQKRIDSSINQHNELLRWLQVKIQFIEAVLDDKIEFKNKTRKQIETQIQSTTDATQRDLTRLLSLNFTSLTKEQVTALRKEIKDAETSLRYWKKTKPNDQFVEDLDGL
jgi:DNA gyrase/topoisomerase IV subunit A